VEFSAPALRAVTMVLWARSGEQRADHGGDASGIVHESRRVAELLCGSPGLLDNGLIGLSQGELVLDGLDADRSAQLARIVELCRVRYREP